jgi:hypothetical protein
MLITSRMSMSADGYVTTPGGWPALTAVLPLLFGDGMRLTPSISPDAGLTFERSRELPGGSVEIVYDVSAPASDLPGRDAGWSPASQRKT